MELSGQLVQVPGAVEHACGVDDAAERVLGVDRGEQRLELGAIGDVTALDPHRGAKLAPRPPVPPVISTVRSGSML